MAPPSQKRRRPKNRKEKTDGPGAALSSGSTEIPKPMPAPPPSVCAPLRDSEAMDFTDPNVPQPAPDAFGEAPPPPATNPGDALPPPVPERHGVGEVPAPPIPARVSALSEHSLQAETPPRARAPLTPAQAGMRNPRGDLDMDLDFSDPIPKAQGVRERSPKHKATGPPPHIQVPPPKRAKPNPPPPPQPPQEPEQEDEDWGDGWGEPPEIDDDAPGWEWNTQEDAAAGGGTQPAEKKHKKSPEVTGSQDTCTYTSYTTCSTPTPLSDYELSSVPQRLADDLQELKLADGVEAEYAVKPTTINVVLAFPVSLLGVGQEQRRCWGLFGMDRVAIHLVFRRKYLDVKKAPAVKMLGALRAGVSLKKALSDSQVWRDFIVARRIKEDIEAFFLSQRYPPAPGDKTVDRWDIVRQGLLAKVVAPFAQIEELMRFSERSYAECYCAMVSHKGRIEDARLAVCEPARRRKALRTHCPEAIDLKATERKQVALVELCSLYGMPPAVARAALQMHKLQEVHAHMGSAETREQLLRMCHARRGTGRASAKRKRRPSTSLPAPPARYEWHFQEDNKTWTAFYPDQVAKVEKAYIDNPQGDYWYINPKNPQWQSYQLDFKSMTQTNIKTGVRRVVRRVVNATPALPWAGRPAPGRAAPTPEERPRPRKRLRGSSGQPVPATGSDSEGEEQERATTPRRRHDLTSNTTDVASDWKCLCGGPVVKRVCPAPWYSWACDHQGHEGAGRADRRDYVFDENHPVYGCAQIETCNWVMCETCFRSKEVAQQRTRRQGQTKTLLLRHNLLFRVLVYAVNRFKRCNSRCLVCSTALHYPTMKPATCMKAACNFSYRTMEGIGISLTREVEDRPEVLELLVSLCWAAAKVSCSSRDSRKPMGFYYPADVASASYYPEDARDGNNQNFLTKEAPEQTAIQRCFDVYHQQLRQGGAKRDAVFQDSWWNHSRVMNCLKAMRSLPEINEFLHPPGGVKRNAGELQKWLRDSTGDALVYPLMMWLLSSNKAHLRILKGDERIKLNRLPDTATAQFQFQSASPEKEHRFQMLKRTYGSRYGWHGSHTSNWHGILRLGLKNMSKTRDMTTGAVYGHGIYLADQMSYSILYCSHATAMWPGAAAFEEEQRYKCIALCEYINKPGYRREDALKMVRTATGQTQAQRCPMAVVADEECVITRFLIVIDDKSSSLVHIKGHEILADKLTIPGMAR